MWHSFMEYQFLQNAVLASFLASIVCGIIGVIIVEKKLVMMSGGIAHTAYGGVGMGYLLGFEPIIGAFIFSICAALGIGFLKRKGGTETDVVIGLFWSLGMALGIFFIALMPGYPPDLSSYLFGSILTVTQTDLKLMLILTLAVLVVIISFFEYWKSYLFDDEFAHIMGINTKLMEYVLFIMIAMSVVVLIRVVGIVLILALFTAPTAIGGLLTKGLKSRILSAVGIGYIFCILGLWLSYTYDIPSGAAIVMISVSGYFFTLMCIKINSSLYKMRG